MKTKTAALFLFALLAAACDNSINVPVGLAAEDPVAAEQPVDQLPEPDTTSVDVADRDDGATVLNLEVDGVTRTIDAVGDAATDARIDISFFGNGIVAWDWYEDRGDEQSTGGSRYAVVVGDISDPAGVRVGEYGGQLYRIVGGDRIDRTHAVLVAFQDTYVTDPVEGYPNIRVLTWDADNGVTAEIGIDGVMADEVSGVFYDGSTGATHVTHSYHGVADESVVQE